MKWGSWTCGCNKNYPSSSIISVARLPVSFQCHSRHSWYPLRSFCSSLVRLNQTLPPGRFKSLYLWDFWHSYQLCWLRSLSVRHTFFCQLQWTCLTLSEFGSGPLRHVRELKLYCFEQWRPSNTRYALKDANTTLPEERMADKNTMVMHYKRLHFS